jgi:hypothetical protein
MGKQSNVFIKVPKHLFQAFSQIVDVGVMKCADGEQTTEMTELLALLKDHKVIKKNAKGQAIIRDRSAK